MANVVDNFNRTISSEKYNASELKSLIATLMGTNTGKPQPTKPEEQKREKKLNEIQELLKKFTKDYETELKEQRAFFSSVLDSFKTLLAKKQEARASRVVGRNARQKPKATKEEQVATLAMKKLQDEFHKTIGTRGSGFVHDIHTEVLLKEIRDILKTTPSPRSGRRGTVRGGGGGGGNINPPMPPAPPNNGGGQPHKDGMRVIGSNVITGNPDDLRELWLIEKTVERLDKISNQVQKNFLGFNGFDTLVKGISDEERKFTQEIRATAYEIAGVTKDSRGLQRVFEDIGTSYSETGFERGKTQQFYLKNLRAGVKDSSKALAIAKTTLNTERLIGVEAGTLHESFLDMAESGHMTNVQLSAVGKSMRDIAKNTGITGDELASAVKNSEQYIKNLKSASTLTASSVANITELVAISKKLGVGDEMGKLVNAMSSTNAFEQSDQKTKNLLLMATGKIGRTRDLLNGTMSKNFNGMAKGLREVLKDFNIDYKNIENMTEQQLSDANRMLYAATGQGLGDFTRQIEAFEEQGKSLATKLEEINKQKKLNLNLEEQANLVEQERALKASKSLSVLTAMQEATKGTGDGVAGMDKAFSKLERRKNDFAEDMTAMGMDWKDGKQAVKDNLESAIKQVNIGREKAGLGDAGISFKDIDEAMKDKDMFKVVMERLFKAENELGIANKDQLDAVTNAEAKMNSANDSLRDMTQGAFSSLMSGVTGQLLAIVGILSSIAVSVGIIALNTAKDFIQFKSLFTRGAAEAAEEGGETMLKKLMGGGAIAGGGAGAAGKAMPAGLGNFGVPNAKASMPETFGKKMKTKAGGIKGLLEGARDAVWGNGSKKGIFDKMFDVLEAPVNIDTGKIKTSFKDLFSSMKTTAKDGASLVKRSFSGMFGTVVDGAKKIFTKDNIASLARGTGRAFTKGASSIFGLKNFFPVFSDMKTVAKSWRGLASASVKGIKGTYQSIKAVTVGSTLGTATIVFAAIDGIMGAFDGFAEAGKTFAGVIEKSRGELTASMQISSTIGGAIYGILNGVLLGIPGLILSAFGIEDTVKKFITFTVHTVTSLFEGIWDGIKSAFSILKPTFDKIGEQFGRIGKALLGMFNSIFGALGLESAASLEEVFMTLWEVAKPVGKAIGYIAGMLVALPLKLFFELISFGISIIEGAINAISGLIYALSGVIKFIKGYVKILMTPFVAVFEFVSALFSGFSTGNWGEAFSTAFSNIWEYVKGALGDMLWGVVDMGFGILKAVYGLFEAPIKWILEIVSWGWGLISSMFTGGWGMLTSIVSWGWDNLTSFVSGAFSVLIGFITAPFRFAWTIVRNFGRLVTGAFRILRNFGSWIIGLPGTIYNAITGMFGDLWGGIGDGIANFGRGVWNGITGLFGGLLSFFEDPLGTIGSALNTAITSVGTFLYDTFTGVLERAWNWFTSWWKAPKEVVESATGKLTSDAQHAENIDYGMRQNKNMEKAVTEVKNEIVADTSKDIDQKIAELASKEKLYREFSNGQSKNIKQLQDDYDKASGSWSGSFGLNAGLLQEFQMSKEKAINDKASFDKQVTIFEKERKALEQSKLAAPTAISEAQIATPQAATTVNSAPAVDVAKQVEQKKAESSTVKTEILSPELQEMASETNEQTLLLEKMVDLFQQFIDMAKPKAQKTESINQLAMHSPNGKPVRTPNNYYRSPVGHVTQTSAKSVSNVGMKNI